MITLGIIGVVAAMTIPNLIANAQKKSVVSGLQEAQSILNQAVKMYSYESDEEGTGDFVKTCLTVVGKLKTFTVITI